MAMRRLNLNLTDDVVNRIDVYAKKIGVSRTAAISFLIVQGMQVESFPESLEKLVEVSKRVKE
jgi:metal-responsive CopG/Arc/MetJ family transcriptional regulator